MPYLIPVMMWLTCFVLSGLGPGPTTIFAFMPAIILGMSDRIKLNKMVAAVCIVGGGVAGGYTPISLCYATVENCLAAAGYTEAEAAAMLPHISFNNILAQALIFVVIYIICRFLEGGKPQNMRRNRPRWTKSRSRRRSSFSSAWRSPLFSPMLEALIPGVSAFATISGAIEPSLLFCVLLVLSLLFKLGNEKKALNFIPWGTIILVCGTSMLVAVASSAGAIDYLSHWISGNMSPIVAKAIVAICAGIMSLFSSTLGVVGPTLIPFIPGISAATGVSATALISAIMVGGHFAGVSPFSTGGAMTMAGETDETKKNKTLYLPYHPRRRFHTLCVDTHSHRRDILKRSTIAVQKQPCGCFNRYTYRPCKA